jgi:hypothetical protein
VPTIIMSPRPDERRWFQGSRTLVGALVCGATLSCGGARSAAPLERTAEREVVVDGINTLASAFGPKETMDRLEAAVRAKGMTVFARIDHTAGATEVGLSLRPTELLIFGNARAGTPLMQAKHLRRTR